MTLRKTHTVRNFSDAHGIPIPPHEYDATADIKRGEKAVDRRFQYDFVLDGRIPVWDTLPIFIDGTRHLGSALLRVVVAIAVDCQVARNTGEKAPQNRRSFGRDGMPRAMIRIVHTFIGVLL